MSEIRVLVTGVSSESVGGQVCKALQQNADQYFVVASSMQKSIVPEALIHEFLEVPSANSEDYISQIEQIVRQHQIEFIVPGSEPELVRLVEHRDSFQKLGATVLANSLEIIQNCLDKEKTFEVLTTLGFAVPKTYSLLDYNSAKNQLEQFPYIIKPKSGAGSASVFIAQDAEELEFFVNYILKNKGEPMIQEYVGTPEDEYTVGVLHSPQRTLLGCFGIRRFISNGISNKISVFNRTGNDHLGSKLVVSSGVSQGEITTFAPVLETAIEIARALGSIGPLNIQGRWNGGMFIPFEINPRFSGTSAMRAMAGFCEPHLLIRAYKSEEMPDINWVRTGRFTRHLVERLSIQKE
jgi:carbamoyl-phosphate synthase large subunit